MAVFCACALLAAPLTGHANPFELPPIDRIVQYQPRMPLQVLTADGQEIAQFGSERRDYVPLSKNGIIAGSMLVFIPAVGEFVIPELLGGPETLMIGRVLWQEFFNNRDWPVASAVAMVMLALLIIPIMIFHRAQAKEMEGKLT